MKRRAGQSIADTAEAIVWLQQQIDQLRLKVEEADGKVADYKAQNGIFAGSNGTTLPDQQISDIGKQITDAQAARNAAQQRADYIRSLLKCRPAASTAIDDVRATARHPGADAEPRHAAVDARRKVGDAAAGAPDHQGAQRADRSSSTADPRRGASGSPTASTRRWRSQDGILASLTDDLARAKRSASTQTQDSVTLDSLTREANAQRDLLNAYLLKYRDASGRTDIGAVLPDVRIDHPGRARRSPRPRPRPR